MPSSNLFMIDIEGTTLSEMERTIIQHPKVGAVILFTRNYTSPQQLELLINDIRKIKADVFITTDHEGGFVQRFLRQGFRSLPAARVYGDTYDLNPEVGIELARKYGEIMAQDLLALGIDLSLAPILDLHDNSSVIAHLDRAFHHDPEGIIALAGAFIDGMNEAGMPAIGKHFPGHGSVSADSHIAMPVSYASREELNAKDLKPFIELIKQDKLAGVMPAHVTYKSVDANKPAGFSSIWLQDILRQEMNFNGIILSDCLSMTGADIGNLMTRTNEALNAGCDMLIVCHQPREVLLELVQTVSFCPSADSVARMTHFKNQMQRFTHPHKIHMKSFVSEAVETATAPISSGLNLQFNTTKSV